MDGIGGETGKREKWVGQGIKMSNTKLLYNRNPVIRICSLGKEHEHTKMCAKKLVIKVDEVSREDERANRAVFTLDDGDVICSRPS